jgi:hypothetical protein
MYHPHKSSTGVLYQSVARVHFKRFRDYLKIWKLARKELQELMVRPVPSVSRQLPGTSVLRRPVCLLPFGCLIYLSVSQSVLVSLNPVVWLRRPPGPKQSGSTRVYCRVRVQTNQGEPVCRQYESRCGREWTGRVIIDTSLLFALRSSNQVLRHCQRR